MKYENILDIKIDYNELQNLYLNKKYDELSRKFLNILRFFDRNTLFKVSEHELQIINEFVKYFLYFFTREDYVFSTDDSLQFIQLGPIISNIVAISDYNNTDEQLITIRSHKNNFVKFLALFSSRNHVQVDYNNLFITEKHQLLSSLWYLNYFLVNDYCGNNYHNLINHLNNVNENLKLVTCNFNEAYYSCTYMGLHNDIKIKNKINRLVQEQVKDIKIANKPDKKKIAIITGKWHPLTAVCKSCYGFIESLKDDYDLTLITYGVDAQRAHTSLFKDVKYVNFMNGKIDISQIQDNDFQFAYFPDIGMLFESIFLANMRIAPIQAAGYGHPSSTYGGEIDYWVGGADVELVEKAELNYSERLVLIPGLGQHSIYPNYEIQNIKKTREDFIINCPWGIKKVNGELINNLKEIINRSQKKVLFRIFPGGGGLSRLNNYLPFVKSVNSILGAENVEIIIDKSYKDYMAIFEEGDITLDSYPYGGYNSMVDTIYLRKPFVAYEGDRFFSRAASQLLREFNLPELIATNNEDYINITLNLINDEAFRNQIHEKFNNLNLNDALFFSGLDKNFKKAVDYIIANHDALKLDKVKTPLIIK